VAILFFASDLDTPKTCQIERRQKAGLQRRVREFKTRTNQQRKTACVGETEDGIAPGGRSSRETLRKSKE
jgi:hypothetical protein